MSIDLLAQIAPKPFGYGAMAIVQVTGAVTRMRKASSYHLKTAGRLPFSQFPRVPCYGHPRAMTNHTMALASPSPTSPTAAWRTRRLR